MMKLKMKLSVAALLAMGLSSATAYGATITFTLANPNEFISLSGGSLTYFATVFAPASDTAPVFLNGDSFNVSAPVTLNDSDFFNNFPLSLAPGTSFTSALFVLTMPPNPPIGTYLGTFTLLGGADGNASGALGTVNFSLTAPVPEPSSFMLMMMGVAGLAMRLLWTGLKEQRSRDSMRRL
jgi:hypothetical protein